MPFTLSHPAAVLPFRRLGLPVTGLVIGSMVPDIPLFLRWDWGYSMTHSLLGVLVVNPVVTLLLLGVWFVVVRDAMVDLAPATVRSRLTPTGRFSPRQWTLAPFAAALGALTHVGWDAFTHPNRWGVRQLTWLQNEHAGLPGYKWAQYISGVVGLVVVCVAILTHMRSLPATRLEQRRALSPLVLLAVLVVAVASAIVSALRGMDEGVHDMAFDGVLASLTVLTLGTLCVCVAWQVAARSRRRAERALESSAV